MRNFKKLLALVLALVMSLSLVAVANATDYTDVASNADHAEAIDVMSGIGVINGYTDGTFKPEGTLTRAEAAKIVAYMLLGDAVEDLPASAPFTDVPAKHWASAPIAYLKNEGIVNGRTATTFDPSAEVNGYEFAKMLLIALGYQADQEGLTGKGYSINAAKLAATAGLNEDVTISKAALNRASAAQMAFNTLKADVVEYAGNTTVTTGDVTVSVSGKASKVAIVSEGSANYAGTGGDGAGYQQFCEKYFKDLKAPAANQTDDFGRPGSAWTYKGEDLAFEADDATYTYVVSESKTLAKFVEDVVKKTFTYAYTDGDAHSKQEVVVVNGTAGQEVSAISALKVGSTVEFFVDDSNNNLVTKVVITEPTVYTLTADAATQVKDDKTQVKVPGVANLTGFSDKYTTENVTGYEGLKKDDVVLVTESSRDQDGDGNTTVIITKAASVTGTPSGMRDGNKLLVSGTAYAKSGLTGVGYDETKVDSAWYENEYTLYLDAAGAIVKAVKNTDNESSDFAYILQLTWVDGGEGAALDASKFAQARLLFTDGTTKVVTVSKIGGSKVVKDNAQSGEIGLDTVSDKNVFATYTVDSDGKYELTLKGKSDITTKAITGGKAKFDTEHTGNASTIFLVNTSSASDKKAEPKITVYTGIANVPSTKSAKTASGAAYVDDGISKYVYLEVAEGDLSNSGGEYIYIPGTGDENKDVTYDSVPKKGDVPAHYEMTGVVDGQANQTIMIDNSVLVKDKSSKDGDGIINKLWKVKTKDSNGIITDVEEDPTSTTGVEYSDGVLLSGSDPKNIADSATVYYITTNGSVSVIAPKDIVKDETDKVYVVETSGTDEINAEVVYILQVISDTNSVTSESTEIIVTVGGSGQSVTKDSSNFKVDNATAETAYKVEIKVAGATVELASDSAPLEGTTAATSGKVEIKFTLISESGKRGTPITLTINSAGV